MTEQSLSARCSIRDVPEEVLEMILLRVAELETDEFEFSAGGRLVGKQVATRGSWQLTAS